MDEQAHERRAIGLLLALTVVTGLVDAVSYLGLGHVFTANMTGNVVLLGFAVAGAPNLSAARSLVSVAAFLLGAVAGGRAGAALSATHRRWMFMVGAVEAALLFAAAVGAIGMTANEVGVTPRLYMVVVLTAMAMGVRMATVRRLAIPDITTTVLTTTLAGLAGESTIAGGNNPRVGRRAGSVVAMFFGAALGTVLLRSWLVLPLVVSGACVLVTNLVYAYVTPSS